MLILMPSLMACWIAGMPSRAGNLDHYVLATDRLPQSSRLLDRALGIAGRGKANFEADISVAALRALVHRLQKIGGVLNVADGENLVSPFGVEIGAGLQRVQQIGVQRAAGDGFLEDGGVGSHARKPSSWIRRFNSPPVSRSRRM